MAQECKVAIGVDLGTSNTCVGLLYNGKIEIISNDLDKTITPSVVGFTDDEILVGEEALELRDTQRTIFDVKRLIGKGYNSKSVHNDMLHWPFTVHNEGGYPVIKIERNGEKKYFKPEEISAEVLKKMKFLAEERLKVLSNGRLKEVKDAVITVPAYFDNYQRAATRKAGEMAGLNVLRAFNEPTAAAVGYGMKTDDKENRTFMVYDLGGGTFDVTVMRIEGKYLEVKATKGDSHLGGEDFNNNMFDHFDKMIQEKHNQEIKEDKGAVQKLRVACENLKKRLSGAQYRSQKISLEPLEDLLPGITFVPEMTRECFEELNLELFKKTIETVEATLKDSGLEKEDIYEVVLVGGSSRIPIIQEMLITFFGKDKLSKGVFPEEAVAKGATIQARMILENITGSWVLQDVIPLSLGVAVQGKIMSFLIKRNTKLPATCTERFTTSSHNQEAAAVKVFQGERLLTRYNTCLGTLELGGLSARARGGTHFDITFNVDEDSLLHVKVKEADSTNETDVTLEPVKDLSEEEVAEMVRDAESNADNDMKETVRVRLITDLDEYLSDILRTIKTIIDNDSDTSELGLELLVISMEVFKIKEWLVSDEGQNAELVQYILQHRKVESLWNPYIKPLLERSKIGLSIKDKEDPDKDRDNSGDNAEVYYL